jgi:hypothetical protein
MDCRYKYVFYEKRGDSPCSVCDETDCEKSFYFSGWDEEERDDYWESYWESC